MPRGDRLFDLLAGCSDSQLMALWTRDLRKKPTTKEFDRADAAERHLLISAELRSVAGHTLDNRRRAPHDLEWKQVVETANDGLSKELGMAVSLITLALAEGSARPREEARLIAMVDQWISKYVQGRGEAGLPSISQERIELEDEALRSVGRIAADFDQAEGVFDKVSRALDVVNRAAGIHPHSKLPLKRAMEPNLRKVVPAVVRLLQNNEPQTEEKSDVNS